MNELILEHEHFVEIQGEMYCTKETCEGCPFISKCKNETETVFSNMSIPIRSIIRTDNNSTPYKTEVESLDTASDFISGRFKGNTIPYSNKRVYKVILDITNVEYKNREIKHIIFNQGKYYCIKQRCSNCLYKQDCKRQLEIKSYSDYIIAMDLKAQEPRSFLLSTKLTGNLEKIWENTFANDSIRERKEYNTLEIMFKHLNIDTTTNNKIFQLWLDKSFFYDATDMFKLQTAVNKYYTEQNDETRAELQEIIDKLYNSYIEFEREKTDSE